MFSKLPELRNKLRRTYAKWKRLGGTTTWEKLKPQKSSDNTRSPSAKSPRLPMMDTPKTSTTAKDADANMVPNSALPTGKNAANAKGRATLLNTAVARHVGSSSKRSSQQKQIPKLRKKFHEATADLRSSEADFSEYDTDEVTV